MPIRNRILSALAIAAFAASSFPQTTILPKSGTASAIKSATVNPMSFNPRIKPRDKGMAWQMKSHEEKWDYATGNDNDLVAPAQGTFERIVPTSLTRFPAIGASGSEPPDPDLAVSTTHIVAVVNTTVAFFTKNGTKVFERAGEQFFAPAGAGNFVFDPKVIYDRDTQRFFMVFLDVDFGGSKSAFLIGVSEPNDPTKPWKLYKVDNKVTKDSADYWLDYPGIGNDKDLIIISGNMFGFTAGGVFASSFVFDKASLIAGTATAARYDDDTSFTIQWGKNAQLNNAGVYGVATGSQTSMTLFGAVKATGGATIKKTTITVPRWFGYTDSVGPGGKVQQANDPRTLNSYYRSGRLVSTHSAGVSQTDSRPAARWYEFNVEGWLANNTAPTLFQSGQVNPPPGDYYSFPAGAINAVGDIALTFSRINGTTPGDVMAAGRKKSDTIGRMSAPIKLEGSLATSYAGGSRWGDYFDTEVDPSDNRTFWMIGMGSGANRAWMTFIKSFTVSLPDADLVALPPLLPETFQGTYLSGDASSLAAADGSIYAVRSVSVKGIGQTAAVKVTFDAPAGPAGLEEVRIKVRAAAANGASGILFLKNRATGSYDRLDAVALATAGVDKTFSIREGNLAKYVAADGTIDAVFRAIVAPRLGRIPPSFMLSVDQFSGLALPILP